MKRKNDTLVEGLRLVYLGNVVLIVCLALTLVLILAPILALLPAIGVIIAALVPIVGIFKLRNEHVDYQNALIAWVVGIIVGLLGKIPVLSGVMDLIGSIASLVLTYFVIRATDSFLREMNEEEIIAKGKVAWIWALIAGITSFVFDNMMELLQVWLGNIMSPVALGTFFMILAILLAGLGICGTIFFLRYLNSSIKAFQEQDVL